MIPARGVRHSSIAIERHADQVLRASFHFAIAWLADGLPQQPVYPVELAIHVKWRGQRHERCDLARGAVVLIPQCKKELVAWAQRRHRRVESLQHLLSFELFVRRWSTVR